ncbi:MAG: hypothetical protein E2O59_04705 [Gammaproteobacteria bacterium]|nr:MAG: hypothetical protein E2O59_04705 [Gammaproteobacteria bacterium]
MESRIAMLFVPILAAGLLNACTITESSRTVTKQANQLARVCYAENDGARLAIGGGPTWLACIAWAQSQVP